MKAPSAIQKRLRAAFRPRLFLLLFAVAVSFSLPAMAASMDPDAVTEWGPLVVAGILLPLVWSFRRESRESLHELRDKMQALALAVARLEERDRIAEVLDKRLPK